jgi:hypothetical protein
MMGVTIRSTQGELVRDDPTVTRDEPLHVRCDEPLCSRNSRRDDPLRSALLVRDDPSSTRPARGWSAGA